MYMYLYYVCRKFCKMFVYDISRIYTYSSDIQKNHTMYLMLLNTERYSQVDTNDATKCY